MAFAFSWDLVGAGVNGDRGVGLEELGDFVDASVFGIVVGTCNNDFRSVGDEFFDVGAELLQVVSVGDHEDSYVGFGPSFLESVG